MNQDLITTYKIKGQDDESSIFGYQIPYLPDFLKDHSLLGQTTTEKLSEIFYRFQYFILGLKKYVRSAYALQFVSSPHTGKIDLFLFGRITAPAQEKNFLINQAILDLETHLKSFYLPFVRVKPPQYNPSFQPSIVEIRQFEKIQPFFNSKSEAYLIYPFREPNGTLQTVMDTLLQLPQPVTLNIFLEPTMLSEQESMDINEAAFVAEMHSEVNQNLYSNNSIRKHDPGAEFVGKVYQHLNQSLQSPFILVVQSISEDPNCAWTAARAFSTAISQTTNSTYNNGLYSDLPKAAEIHIPETSFDIQSANLTYKTMIWHPWGIKQASQGKERLPFLVGPEGAACAFRFPIATSAGIPGIKVKQLQPNYEQGQRIIQTKPDELYLGKTSHTGSISIPIHDLARHVLITGYTGSGKTNTVFTMLYQLWDKFKIPFLVIESAKKEYRDLASTPALKNDMIIFTLGDESTAPFRFNPFEVLSGVRVEAHIARLQTCFDAAFPQFGILPTIVSESLETIYHEKGWIDTEKGQISNQKDFPTLQDFYNTMLVVSESRGYKGEFGTNLKAAVASRIGELLRGSTGKMLNCQKTYGGNELLKKPLILEINDLNEDKKALITMFLLVWLREMREQTSQSELTHVTVVEEAHNILGRSTASVNTEVSSDVKAKSVNSFANLLSEIRSFGEGIIISDQSPEKLAQEAIRNTNLQIAHQLRSAEDRDTISRSINLNELQQEYLTKLEIGEAAVFHSRMSRATFFKTDQFTEIQKSFSDETVKQFMEPHIERFKSHTPPFRACQFCKSKCVYQNQVSALLNQRENLNRIQEAVYQFEYEKDPDYLHHHWSNLGSVCVQITNSIHKSDPLGPALCILINSQLIKIDQKNYTFFQSAITEVDHV